MCIRDRFMHTKHKLKVSDKKNVSYGSVYLREVFNRILLYYKNYMLSTLTINCYIKYSVDIIAGMLKSTSWNLDFTKQFKMKR